MSVAQPLNIKSPALNARKLSDFALTLPFIIFFLVQLAHHQLWVDEINAWAMAAASPNLKTLIGYVHYEGHPALWYMLLWLPAHFSLAPEAMKVIEGALGIGIYLMIGVWSPFSRFEKVLLFLSYYISFEYTVLSRMYSVLLLVLLIYVYRRSKYPEQFLWNTALLGLLANTDVLGAILSGSLLVEYAWSEWRKRQSALPRKEAVSALLIYVLLAAFSVWTGLPSHTSVHSVEPFGKHAFQLWHLTSAIRQVIVSPWWPINAAFPDHFWNPGLRLRTMLLVPVILGAYYVIFKREWIYCWVIGLTTVAAILFNHLVYFGYARHFGITFLAFLAVLWMQRYHRAAAPMLGRILLGFSAAAGLLVAGAQWQHPFCNGGAAANWLRAHHLENSTLIGAVDIGAAPVAEELQRPMYYLDCNCWNTFLLYSSARDSFSVAGIPRLLADAVDRLHSSNLHSSNMILVTPFQLKGRALAEINERGVRLAELAAFTRAEFDPQNAFIYRVSKAK